MQPTTSGFSRVARATLWHLDFHEGSRPVLVASGQWQKPKLLGVLDDRSRLCCHLQWYLDETAETLIHALSQAFHKRGLPRALPTDNGAAMIAAQTTEGLERLGIVHRTVRAQHELASRLPSTATTTTTTTTTATATAGCECDHDSTVRARDPEDPSPPLARSIHSRLNAAYLFASIAARAPSISSPYRCKL